MDGRKIEVWFPARAEILIVFYNTEMDSWTQTASLQWISWASSSQVMRMGRETERVRLRSIICPVQTHKFYVYHIITNTFQAM